MGDTGNTTGRKRGAPKRLAPEPSTSGRRGGLSPGQEFLLQITEHEVLPLGRKPPGQQADGERRRLVRHFAFNRSSRPSAIERRA